MQRVTLRILLWLGFAAFPACGLGHDAHAPAGYQGARPGAPLPVSEGRLLPGTGNYRFRISTRSPLAQRFFDQGLVLAWGFNFAEAERSFREASRLDPECAMCLWGIAFSLGPSINHDMSQAAATAAYSAARKAVRFARAADAKERALIDALARRYKSAPKADRSAPDRAYARAMRGVAQRFPADADVLTLFADALMTPHGRDYWRKDGSPEPWTRDIIAALERALKLAPDHPGANHFHVHVLEDSPHPERAKASAERLRAIAPGVGHLVHMPSHVYLRLGDYAGALRANEEAIAADRAYLAMTAADAGYVYGYVEHNVHFLWYAAVMSGHSAAALSAAAELARGAESAAGGPPGGTRQHFLVLPLYTQVRFGRWQDILASDRPVAATGYTDGVRHYARGMAYLRTGRADRAREELERVNASLRAAAVDGAELKNTNRLSALLEICFELLRAELGGAQGDHATATAHARAALKAEMGLAADEPPAWHMPARHTLGALLLAANRAAEAERVFREDLAVHPANGWALAGLAESLARQGSVRAAEARERFERAWQGADVAISGSRF